MSPKDPLSYPLPPAEWRAWVQETAVRGHEALKRLEAQSPAQYDGHDDADPSLTFERRICAHLLLSREDEAALSAALRYSLLLLHKDPRTEEEERARVLGDRAGKFLVRCNAQLVLSIAVKYRDMGMALADLFQEGNLGLMHAANRYEPWRGLKFSTFATWWIRQNVTRALADQSRSVRLPVHMVDKMRWVMRFYREAHDQTGIVPTTAEIKEGLKEQGHEVSLAAIEQALRWEGGLRSLDAELTEGEAGSLFDYLPDVEVDPLEAPHRDEQYRALLEAMTCLDERARDILCLRYGLSPATRAHTLAEIGKKVGLTRERVRQLEAIALRKLRAPDTSKKLRPLLSDYRSWVGQPIDTYRGGD